MESLSFILDLGLSLVFAVPILVSNAVPAILGGGYPIDAYKNFFDGKRILGDHKTILGLVSGIFSGFLSGVIIWVLSGDFMLSQYGSLGFHYPFWIGILMGWGCNFGDLFGSFVKRRLNLESGSSLPVFDQMGYILFGLLWSWIAFRTLPWVFWLSLLVLAPLIHITANRLAYLLKIKDVPW